MGQIDTEIQTTKSKNQNNACIFQVNFDGKDYPSIRMGVHEALKTGEKVTIIRNPIPEKQIIPGTPEAAQYVVDMINAANPDTAVDITGSDLVAEGELQRATIFPDACFYDGEPKSETTEASKDLSVSANSCFLEAQSAETPSLKPIFSATSAEDFPSFKEIINFSDDLSELNANAARLGKIYRAKMLKDTI